MEEPGSSVEYRFDQRRAFVALAAGVLFVGAGVWLINQGFLVAVLGATAIVFGGWGVVAIGRRLVVGGWTIRADSREVSFGPASYLAGWSIPWSAIDRIGVATMQRQRMLGVALVDPAVAAASVPAVAAKSLVRMARGARVLGGTAMVSSMLLGRLFLRGDTADSAATIMTSRTQSMTDLFALNRGLCGFDIGIDSAFLDAPLDEVVDTLDRLRCSN